MPNFVAYGNGGRSYQLLSFKNQNRVQVPFFVKYQEHHRLDFLNLNQNCHTAVQYLIRFLL